MISPVSRTLRKKITVNASVKTLWKAWTTEEGIRTFFAPQGRIELRPGGKYEIYFDPEAPTGSRGSENCRIKHLEPFSRLVFSWNFPPSLPELRNSGAKTTVKLEFEDVEGISTRIILEQTGWQEGNEWDKGFDYFDRAWTHVLQNLKRNFDKVS